MAQLNRQDRIDLETKSVMASKYVELDSLCTAVWTQEVKMQVRP